MSEFNNQVVVISGSASGIGAASSKLYAELAHMLLVLTLHLLTILPLQLKTAQELLSL